jgi:hypothetical protein
VSAVKGTAVLSVLFGGVLLAAFDGDPALPWLLLGFVAASYAFCFGVMTAWDWWVYRQYERKGPPPTRFVGGRGKALVMMALLSIAIGLCAGLLARASGG